MHLDQISSTKVRFDPFILVTIILFSSALRHSLYFALPYCLSALGLEPALRGPSPQLNTKLLYYIFYCGILYLFYCFNFDSMAGAAVTFTILNSSSVFGINRALQAATKLINGV